MTDPVAIDNNDKSNNNDRESQFLASQQARLAKIHDNSQSKDEDGNADIQLQRKLFWQTFKHEYYALDERLSGLVQQQPQEGEEKDGGSATTTTQCRFITSQQRNEALEKLQQIQYEILAINHYTLRSTKASSSEIQFLPEHFATNEMPELPLADVRMLNAEIQLLKKRTKEIEQIIIPKEKFRFKRYHALMQQKKQLNISLLEDEDMIEDGKEEEGEDDVVNDSGSNSLHLSFDGLTLSKKKDCIIVVESDGTIVVKNLEQEVFDKIIPSSILLKAKAFLIRDVLNCQVQVNGLYNSVHIINAKNTTIQIVSPTHGPVHVTNCQESTIQIPFSRQLRIHDCTNVSFIIHVASGPIIEGCKGMKFYQKDYTPRDGAVSDTGGGLNFGVGSAGVNLYWDVKDFHWLKNNVKSPNFDTFTNEQFEKEDQDGGVQDLLQKFAKALHLEDDGKNSGSVDKKDEESSSMLVEDDSANNSDGGLVNDDEDDSSEDEL